MADVCSSIVTGGIGRAAGFLTDFLPVIALALGIPLAGILVVWIKTTVNR